MLPREIRIEDATPEWLEGYFLKFNLGFSVRSETEARKFYLSDGLGVSVDDLTVQSGFISFTTGEVYRDTLVVLLDTTILYEGKRLVLSEIGSELYSIAYQEGESATLRIEFREKKA